jgi:hypothetical protein
MKVFILFLALASAQVLATETETETSTAQIKTTEAQVGLPEEQQPERVKLEIIKATPERRPANWVGGGRNFR